MLDHAAPLRETDVDADPVRQFHAWMRAAREAGVRESEAAAVATATSDGRPSVRMVLVKRADQHGFVFYTNYESRKGSEIETNPRAALLWHWDVLGRQIRIEGSVARVASEETADYLRVRSRGSRLSALASPQSRPVPDREWLEDRVAQLAALYGDGELPQADNWGGLRLSPERFEFWQNRRDRLHDRLVYLPDGAGWKIERLAP